MFRGNSTPHESNAKKSDGQVSTNSGGSSHSESSAVSAPPVPVQADNDDGLDPGSQSNTLKRKKSTSSGKSIIVITWFANNL